MTAITKIQDAISTIGRTLPLGTEVWFGRDPDDPRVKMEIVYPSGEGTTYAFRESDPVGTWPPSQLAREGQLEKVLRDLLATIELHTDCMSGLVDVDDIGDQVEAAETLLADGWEPEDDSAAVTEPLRRHCAATTQPDTDRTVLCWGSEGFFCGWWEGAMGGWMGCESGGSVVGVTHWADPSGPPVAAEIVFFAAGSLRESP